MRIVVSAGAVFGGVVEQVEQHLLEQTPASSSSIGTIGRQFDIDLVVRQNLGGTGERAAHEFVQIVKRRLRNDRAGFEPGHVEQVGNEPVEPLRFVDDGRQELGLGGVVERTRKLAQGSGRAQNGGKRRLEIVRDRRQQR